MLAGIFTFVFNYPLLSKTWGILLKLEDVDLGFAVSIPVVLLSIFSFAFALLCTRHTTKPVLSLLFPVAAVVSYTMSAYGIVVDRDMIMNFMETNYGEAVTYLNVPAILWVLGIGIMPAIGIWFLPVKYPPLKKTAIQKALTIFIALSLVGGAAALYYKDYASVIRNNPQLRRMIVPSYAIDAFVTHIRKTYFYMPRPYLQVGTDAQQKDPDIGKKKDLIVLVVGETQRSMNYSLNGYKKHTNAYTDPLGVMSFRNTMSCGTATAISVPCMFSNLGRKEYKKEIAESQDNLLDVAEHADVHVLWLDNDSGCKGVCKNVNYIDLRNKYKKMNSPLCNGESCYDEVFLKEFEQQLLGLPDQTSMIVIHLMGSHGPTYFERYPAKFKVFLPDCPRSDIQNCTTEELVNTYDNTIVYSDYVIAGIIKTLEKYTDKRTPALLFMSDHGESLGESGMYLHGVPYALAPDEQKHIPFITWMSDEFAKDRKINTACVKKLIDNPYSHDNLFHTVLGMLDIEVGVYKKELDVFAPCRDFTKESEEKK